jgi:hypothetical protein
MKSSPKPGRILVTGNSIAARLTAIGRNPRISAFPCVRPRHIRVSGYQFPGQRDTVAPHGWVAARAGGGPLAGPQCLAGAPGAAVKDHVCRHHRPSVWPPGPRRSTGGRSPDDAGRQRRPRPAAGQWGGRRGGPCAGGCGSPGADSAGRRERSGWPAKPGAAGIAGPRPPAAGVSPCDWAIGPATACRQAFRSCGDVSSPVGTAEQRGCAEPR